MEERKHLLKKPSSLCGHCLLVYEVCQSFTSTDPVLLNLALAGALGSNRQCPGQTGSARVTMGPAGFQQQREQLAWMSAVHSCGSSRACA